MRKILFFTVSLVVFAITEADTIHLRIAIKGEEGVGKSEGDIVETKDANTTIFQPTSSPDSQANATVANRTISDGSETPDEIATTLQPSPSPSAPSEPIAANSTISDGSETPDEIATTLQPSPSPSAPSEPIAANSTISDGSETPDEIATTLQPSPSPSAPSEPIAANSTTSDGSETPDDIATTLQPSPSPSASSEPTTANSTISDGSETPDEIATTLQPSPSPSAPSEPIAANSTTSDGSETPDDIATTLQPSPSPSASSEPTTANSTISDGSETPDEIATTLQPSPSPSVPSEPIAANSTISDGSETPDEIATTLQPSPSPSAPSEPIAANSTTSDGSETPDDIATTLQPSPSPSASSEPTAANSTTSDGSETPDDIATTLQPSPSPSASSEPTAANSTTTSERSAAEKMIKCIERSPEPRIEVRDDYEIFYNLVPMRVSVKCWETVTFVTQSDFLYLHHVEPVVERWKAPVSVAVYAPGSDLETTLDSIKYLRSCSNPLISQFVTFHVYVHTKHISGQESLLETMRNNSMNLTYDCNMTAPWAGFTSNTTYKGRHNLVYPINVGRNIAKEAALTHYLMVADIELYPSENLPTDFIDMVIRHEQLFLWKPRPKVFVVSPFEVTKESVPPTNKTELVKMLNKGTAIPFHDRTCRFCHAVPGAKYWKKAPQTNTLRVKHTDWRTGRFGSWEPVYIGTHDDPIYDERVTWDGQSDKRIQGWILCALDYTFHILNNAFVVHAPGIKLPGRPPHPDRVAETNELIESVIIPEYRRKYGMSSKCQV